MINHCKNLKFAERQGITNQHFSVKFINTMRRYGIRTISEAEKFLNNSDDNFNLGIIKASVLKKELSNYLINN